MTHVTTQIPRADWPAYLEWLTGQLPGTEGTIEHLGEDIGDQVEVARAPVRAIRWDDDATAIAVILHGPADEAGHDRHLVTEPVELWTDVAADTVPSSLLVERAGGERTLVRLAPEPALDA